MTAVRDGDEWVINGQKVWTSGAQYSDFGEIICRTNPDAEKHKGITAFIVDMRAPGVTIKPLKQMNGGASFNEVFFDDVRVPARSRARRRERRLDGRDHHADERARRDRIRRRWRRPRLGARPHRPRSQRGVNTDPLIRQRLADLYTKSRISKFSSMRTLTAALKGQVPGPEGSIGKLFGGRMHDRDGRARDRPRRRRRGRRGDDDYRWHQALLGAPAAHIAGGSDEVMKNIIGERVLGLPGEPRVDKGVPWNEVLR